MGMQHLGNERRLLLFTDSDQGDRKVARNPGTPQRRCRAPAPLQHFGRRPQTLVMVDEIIGQQLKQMRIVAANAQILKLGLRVGGRQGGRPLERRGVMVTVHQIEYLLARRGRHGPEGQCHGLAARDQHTPAQAEDGIEHRTVAVGQGPTFEDRRCRAGVAAPRQELAAIGLILDIAHRAGFGDTEMCRPDRLFGRGPRPATCQKRAGLTQIFGFHKQLGKGLVGIVIGGFCQRQFGIGRYLDLAQTGAIVGDGYAPHFRIILGRHQHFHESGEGMVGATDGGAIFREHGFIRIRLLRRGLIAR